jgi:HD-GYP domain-containing protein (c-di-GMP phosphodiesterase class II)
MRFLPEYLSRKVLPIDYHLRAILFRVILPATIIAALLSITYSIVQYRKIGDLVFDGVKRRADILITESVSGIRKATNHYEKDIMRMLNELYAQVEKEVIAGKPYPQINFEGVIEKYRKRFPSELFEDINYYIISKSGKIVWTDYKEDLGLDLSKFEDFWKSLNVALEKGLVLHRTGIEVMTGKMRVYAYKRLPNGDILEIGLLLNDRDFIENLRKLKGLSIFLENIGVYNVAQLPILSDFPPYPKRLLKFHPYKRDLVGEIAIGNSPPYEQRLLVSARLNFYSLFKMLIFNLTMFIFLFFVTALVSFHLSKWVKRETGYIKEALKDFRKYKVIKIDADVSRTVEVRELLSTLKEAALEINLEVMENQTLIRELKESFYDFAEKLALAAEGYDTETGEHLQRVKFLTRLLVENLEMPEDLKEEIINYSVLHDVGKIFIPLSILNKPGPLDPQEWELMKQHTIFAKRLLTHPRFKIALEIALYHHENYDGTGYPFGLSGEAIPIPGRIIKVVDVYEALRSERPYKKPLSHEEAVKILLHGDNRTKPEHFDPVLLKKFLEALEKADLSAIF